MEHNSRVAPPASIYKAAGLTSAGGQIRRQAKLYCGDDPDEKNPAATREMIEELIGQPKVLFSWASKHDPEFRTEHLKAPYALEALATAYLAAMHGRRYEA